MYLIKHTVTNLSLMMATSVLLVVILFIQINNSIFITAQTVSEVRKGNMLSEPSTLIIVTNPPTPGVQAIIDGKPYRSDNNGKIIFNTSIDSHRIEIPHILSYEKQQNETSKVDLSSFITFGRWEPFMPKNFTLTLNAGTRTTIELGIIRNSQVNFEFLDADSNPINKSKIERILLISKSGKTSEITYPFEGFLEENFLTKRQYVKDDNNVMVISAPQPYSNPQIFRIMEISMDNINIVDKSKNLEFYPKNTSSIHAYTKVYPLKIEMTDRILGSPIDAGISLEVTDDSKLNSTESKQNPTHFEVINGELNIPQLPKATYIIKTDKGIGFGGSAAVVLDKPQEIKIPIITYTSAIILGIISLTVLIVAVLIVRKITKYLSSRYTKNIDNKGM